MNLLELIEILEVRTRNSFQDFGRVATSPSNNRRNQADRKISINQKGLCPMAYIEFVATVRPKLNEFRYLKVAPSAGPETHVVVIIRVIKMIMMMKNIR